MPAQADNLSALDLLSINGLVNYFGKQDKLDDIRIKPILIQKGDTKVSSLLLSVLRGTFSSPPPPDP